MLQFKKFPDIPVSPERNHEGPAHIQRSPISASLLGMMDPFPAWSGKNSWRSRRLSSGGALHRKGERNSRVVPSIPESPRCVSPFQRNLFSLHCLYFHAEDRLTPRCNVRHTCGKASWESLEGKPQISCRRNRKRDTDATAPEESARACPHSRRGLTPLGRLQKYPKIHVCTGEESSGSSPASTQGLPPRTDGRGTPRGPLATRRVTGLS